MHIVWAASYGGRQRGGFVPAAVRVAELALARGDAFDLVVPDLGDLDWHGELRAVGAGVHRVRDDGRAAARRVRALRPDLVHAHFHDWLVEVTVGTWLTRARLLWHLHSAFEPGGGPLRMTPRRALKYRVLGARVERFVCVTATIAAEARQLGVPQRKVVVVRNAIDSRRFHPPGDAERRAARERLGLGQGPVIAFFGRDPAIKGADILSAALGALPGVTVLAVATPEETVADLARSARVVSIDFTDDVREVFWAADALALPSRAEGMPFAALEARGCGVPVVTSDLPWAVELAAADPGVRLSRTGDGGSLAAGLRAALAGSQPRPALGAGDVGDWARTILGLYHGGR